MASATALGNIPLSDTFNLFKLSPSESLVEKENYLDGVDSGVKKGWDAEIRQLRRGGIDAKKTKK